jgi:hypothetical protein
MTSTRTSLLLCALALTAAGSAPAAAGDRDATIERLNQRLFPTLNALDLRAAPPALRALLLQRRQRMDACGADAACRIGAAVWSEAEKKQLGGLATGAAQDTARLELEGLNQVLRVYGQGAAPRYPEIDGPGDVGTPRFKAEVAAAVALGQELQAAFPGADPSVPLALALVDGANRLDAVAFEPLALTENREAAQRAPRLDWAKYPYTAIIVPGLGPEDLDTPLSAGGKLRVQMAVKRYFAGQAPYILVSGAAVHPRHSRFVEALEMRRALIERFGVPREAILVDPYARHTTTNLRNAARLLAGLRAPAGRPALIVTDVDQSSAISSDGFRERCLKELGYLPGALGERLAPTDLEFIPSTASLRVDPADPLDP